LPEPQQNWIQGTSGQGTPYWYTQDGQYSDTNPNSIEPPQGNPQTNAVNPNLFYGNGDTSGSGTTSGTTDSGSKDPSQVIHDLGYDPGDPRSFDPSGSGSGRPTQKAIGLIGNFLGNFAFPGLGVLTGAAASKITQMIQNGASRSAVQNAIARAQSGGGDTTSPAAPAAPSSGGGTPLGSGFNFGDAFSGLPEGFTEGNRFGGGAPTFEGPGFTGPSWSAGGSIFGGRMNPNMNLAGSWNNLGASGGGLAPGMANLYLHGQGMQNWAQGQGYNSVGDWLRQTGFSLGGANPSGAGLSGAGRPLTSSR
jgi:hypothetical protein